MSSENSPDANSPDANQPEEPNSPDYDAIMEEEFFSDDIDRIAIWTVAAVRQFQAEQQAGPSSSRIPVLRDRQTANDRLMNDYFVENPKYNDDVFRERFRMSKRLFLQISSALESSYTYFRQRSDTTGRVGLTSIMKCTCAIRQLAYGVSSQVWDEYLQMGETTTRDSFEYFCAGIVALYGPTFLRRPTVRDLERIYNVHERKHGFPGMIGSIDCMHWRWDGCSNAWRGAYTRGSGHPTVVLQAVASNDLWIWHAFFEPPGSFNDINVFRQSTLYEEYISGLMPKVPFYANDNLYNFGYFLGDGIYPEYALFVKTFTNPIDEKRKHFKKKQESARKDIERAFGVLQKRWAYLTRPSLVRDKTKLQNIVYTCIILHNMILQDENKAICQDYDPNDPSLDPEYWTQQTDRAQRAANDQAILSRETHYMLTADLIDHVWNHTRHDDY